MIIPAFKIAQHIAFQQTLKVYFLQVTLYLFSPFADKQNNYFSKTLIYLLDTIAE
jgi:hypothetical protein